MTISERQLETTAICTLQDKKDLQVREDKLSKCASQWEELLGSCKSALTELKKVSNQKSAAGPSGPAKAKGKAKAKAKGKSKAKKTAEPYAMFSTDAEFTQCPSSAADEGGSSGDTFVFGTPFKGVIDRSSEFLSDAARKALEDFGKEFHASDIRVMTGRGQKDAGSLKSELRPGSSVLQLWSQDFALVQSNHWAGMRWLACFPACHLRRRCVR